MSASATITDETRADDATATARAAIDPVYNADEARAVVDTATARAGHDPASSAVYFDWSRDKIHALHDSDDKVTIYYSLVHLLDSLTEPTCIYCEATFESFEADHRERFLQRCAAEGHDLRVINPRATAKHRRTLGLKKSDDADVHTIRDMAESTDKHFQHPPIRDAAMFVKLRAANDELRDLRNRVGDIRTSPRGKVTVVSNKDMFAEELADLLPDPADLTDTQRTALCNEKKGKKNAGTYEYSLKVVAAVGVAAKHAVNRREFDFIAGLYENGYPSQIRSDLHWWRWGNPMHAKSGVMSKLCWTDYRRELRWLFHECRRVRAGADLA